MFSAIFDLYVFSNQVVPVRKSLSCMFSACELKWMQSLSSIFSAIFDLYVFSNLVVVCVRQSLGGWGGGDGEDGVSGGGEGEDSGWKATCEA